tara:strand:+ start:1467 stop:1730 length:264 start_codon:yes stop_codon:yes gene_type:complete
MLHLSLETVSGRVIKGVDVFDDWLEASQAAFDWWRLRVRLAMEAELDSEKIQLEPWTLAIMHTKANKIVAITENGLTMELLRPDLGQ